MIGPSGDFLEALGGREVGTVKDEEGGVRWTCECGATDLVPLSGRYAAESLASVQLYSHRQKAHA